MFGLVLFFLRVKYEKQKSLVYYTNIVQMNTRSFSVDHRFFHFVIHTILYNCFKILRLFSFILIEIATSGITTSSSPELVLTTGGKSFHGEMSRFIDSVWTEFVSSRLKQILSSCSGRFCSSGVRPAFVARACSPRTTFNVRKVDGQRCYRCASFVESAGCRQNRYRKSPLRTSDEKIKTKSYTTSSAKNSDVKYRDRSASPRRPSCVIVGRRRLSIKTRYTLRVVIVIRLSHDFPLVNIRYFYARFYVRKSETTSSPLPPFRVSSFCIQLCSTTATLLYALVAFSRVVRCSWRLLFSSFRIVQYNS